MSNTIPGDDARFALPTLADEIAPAPDECPGCGRPTTDGEPCDKCAPHCEVCGERLESRHVIRVCDFCSDMEPADLRGRIRHANRVPATPEAGAGGRLLRLGATRLGHHRDFWMVPGVDYVMSAREALNHFGPDELPASLR